MVSVGKNKYEISAYTDELTQKGILNQVAKVKKAFPTLEVEFYDLLIDRIKENDFTDKRMNDAVNKVIDNCKFPKPNISDFVNFDRTAKLFNYSYMCDLSQKWGGKIWERYDKIKVNGVVYWYDKSELA